MTVLDVARAHRAETTKLSGAAHRKAMREWKRVDPDRIAASWQLLLPAAAAALAAAQWHAAIDAEAATLAMLDGQDFDVDGPLLDPSAFAGMMQETGAPVEAALAGVAFHTLDRIRDGVETQKAMSLGGVELARMTNTAVFDVARAVSTGFGTTRTAPVTMTGYTRMAMPGCCVRCSLLVGRFFRWNTGFDRHPSCRCVHIPSSETSSGALETDPYALFEALSEAEQNRIWTKAGAQAIRDGADIYQVGNTIQKRRSDGTRRSSRRRYERSTARSYYRWGSSAGKAGKHRLSVSEIYRRAGGSRERAKELLEQYGYITGAQVPGGMIMLPGGGFGQYGRGGRRVGAREEILRARRTGVRDPNSVYTMTAAELRAHFARLRAA